MNTNFKLDSQVVLTISVLLTATWLPLTTFAQGVSETGNLNRAVGELRSQHLVDCLGGNAKDAALVTPKFSSLTENEIRAVLPYMKESFNN